MGGPSSRLIDSSAGIRMVDPCSVQSSELWTLVPETPL